MVWTWVGPLGGEGSRYCSPIISSVALYTYWGQDCGHTSEGSGGGRGVKAGQGARLPHWPSVCLRHYLQRPSRRQHPHATHPDSCFPLGHSFCNPTGAGVRAAIIRRNIPPQRGPCRHHIAIKRPRGCNGENPSLSLAGAALFSPALWRASLDACDCWAALPPRLRGGHWATRLGLSCSLHTKVASSCCLRCQPPGPAPQSQCHSQLPTVPRRLWGPSKDAN